LEERVSTDRQSESGARVLIVDDEKDLLDLLEIALMRMGLVVGRADTVAEALRQLDSGRYQLCLTDMRLPDGSGLEVVRHVAARHPEVPVAVITAHGNMENAIAVLKAGAFDYLSKPVALDQLRALVKSALKLSEPHAEHPAGTPVLLGQSPAMQRARDLIARVARSQAPVHISGESGSGKELAARLIVEKSVRQGQPLIAVNCGAIPEALMESEFFGYRKGAFTGADRDRDGFFQAASGGTLFLDEVADLPLSMQVKLLRAIQEKKVRKVGDTQEEPVDVRIISATHRSLAEQVQAGRFRQDLYYRLNVIALHMPALREMPDDIPDIARQILARLRGPLQVEFTPDALESLREYDFPGNVRELENLIERALALCNAGIITPADLHLPQAESGDSASLAASIGASAGKYPLPELLDRVERRAILQALRQTEFNRTAAARILGISFRALRYRMSRLGITEQDDGADDEA
jgi:two-component system response regulator PilR (NtrC family)